MKAWLEGHQFDLEALARFFPEGGTRVVRQGDIYYLTSPEIDSPPDGETCHDVAPAVLERLNGIARTLKPNFEPVKLAGAYQEADEEPVRFVTVASAALRIEAGLVAVVTGGASAPAPPPPGPALLNLSKMHAEVAETLALLGKPEPLNWIELYKNFEVIRDSLKPTPLDRSGLATKDEISAFTGSANRPDVSGADARHARMSGPPPKRQMTIGQAREFIGQLARAWMESLK